MKLIKEDIFPTSIYSTDDVLDKTSLHSIKTDVFNSYKKDPRINWQSKPNLHQSTIYKPLVDKIIECGKRIFDGSKIVYSGFKITDMWSNVSKQGEFHRPHTHSNNYLSGVYYVQSSHNNRADIQFYDPRPQADVITPSVTETTRHNSHIWYYPSLENRMLFFPSWLQHYVPANTSDLPRSSIAFNIMLTGKVGADHDLQSAEF